MANFIHTSDWQIGMPFKGLKESSRARMADDRIDVIKSIEKLIKNGDEPIEFVLVCGDLFDSYNPPAALIEKTKRAIEFVTVPVYVISGNHEWGEFQNVFDSEAFKSRMPKNLVILEPGLTRVNDSTEIYALPLKAKHGLEDPFSDYNPMPRTPGVKRILAMHGQLDGMIDLKDVETGTASSQIKLARLIEMLDKGEVDYVALGDRHTTTDVENLGPLTRSSNGRVFYSGAPEPTGYREENQRNVLVVDLSGDEPKVKPREVGKWRFATIGTPQNPIELKSRAEIDDLLDKWQAEESQTTCVKLYCNKYFGVEDDWHLKRRLVALDSDDFAFFRESKRNSEFVQKVELNIEDENPIGLSGFLLDASKELQSAAKSGDELASQALEILAELKARA